MNEKPEWVQSGRTAYDSPAFTNTSHRLNDIRSTAIMIWICNAWKKKKYCTVGRVCQEWHEVCPRQCTARSHLDLDPKHTKETVRSKCGLTPPREMSVVGFSRGECPCINVGQREPKSVQGAVSHNSHQKGCTI